MTLSLFLRQTSKKKRPVCLWHEPSKLFFSFMEFEPNFNRQGGLGRGIADGTGPNIPVVGKL